MSRQTGKGSLTLEVPQASKVVTIFHFNASSPSTPLAPFPFPSPPLPLLLSNKSWAKHSLPPCDLHLKGKLRRGIRAVAMAMGGREGAGILPAICNEQVCNLCVHNFAWCRSVCVRVLGVRSLISPIERLCILIRSPSRARPASRSTRALSRLEP